MAKAVIAYFFVLFLYSPAGLARNTSSELTRPQRLALFQDKITRIQANAVLQAGSKLPKSAQKQNTQFYLRLIQQLENAVLKISKEENRLDYLGYQNQFRMEQALHFCNCKACGYGKDAQARFKKKLKLALNYYNYLINS